MIIRTITGQALNGLTAQVLSSYNDDMGYLERLRPIHREVIRRLVMGQRPADIAMALGISEGTIYNMQRSELFQQELQRMQGLRDKNAVDVSDVLRDIAPVALNVVERIMYSSQSDKVRLDAARDILNRAGYGTTLRVVSDINYHQYTDDELEQILASRLERLKGNGDNGSSITQR